MAIGSLDAQRTNRERYVVRAPRPTDAMQGALRSVYRGDDRTPDDIDALMRRLDTID